MSTMITRAEINNFQRLSHAAIEPTGNLIILAGMNGAGKTSTLDAIESVLCGHNGRNIKRPIKDGHGKASIETTLADGKVITRKYTPSGTTMVAKNADGSKLSQAELNGMISSLGIDASTFATSGEKEQLKTLLSVVELPFVPAELDAERASVFAERRDVNRYVAQLDAQLKAFLPMATDLPDEEVSLSELLEVLRAAEATQQRCSDARSRLWNAESRVNSIRAELAEAESELAGAMAAAKEWELATIPDTDSIKHQIDTAEVTNSQIRVSREKKAVAKNLEVTQREANELTARLAEIDQRKAAGLAVAEMPIDGLSFDDEGVLYQGVPFSRASGAEQIIVSAAMIIATDPELRTMVIRNGNVLDANSLQILQDMGEANDFQIFIEWVTESTDHEYVFVDGELAS
ncbi:AAA family ATPase [Pseudarthrobacter sp. P1]|uniref:AAA family ATPase n=1 Tax=Pseudarthrobacter sp. P1 TaxID=3418418 RepID=UPI003CF56206